MTPEDAAFLFGMAWGVLGTSLVCTAIAFIMTYKANRVLDRDFYGEMYDDRRP